MAFDVTRTGFWTAKFARNAERDARLIRQASSLGWRTLVVWECEAKDQQALERRLVDFIGPPRIGQVRGLS